MSEQDNRMPPQISEQMMIQYLLGELPEAWQAQFEEHLFTDPDCHAQLQIVEENLIDKYVRGELSAERRGRFEMRYLISERRRTKVAFARTLMKAIAEFSTPAGSETTHWRQTLLHWRKRPAALHLAFAGMALILLVGGAYLAIEMAQLHKQQAQLQAELASLQQREQAPQPASQPQPTTAAPPPHVLTTQPPTKPSSTQSSTRVPSHSGVISQVLKPGRVRNIEERRDEHPSLLDLHSGVRVIRLHLVMEHASNYSRYRATLMKAEGQAVGLPNLSKPTPSADREVLILDLPASLLTRGDYVLTLLGVSDANEIEELGDYYFTVWR